MYAAKIEGPKTRENVINRDIGMGNVLPGLQAENRDL
jgi:hypothetical protein